jgi:CO dehydrogenase/acetyl-CoA synthase delta subunit
MDHCVRSYVVVLGHDPSRFLFEFVLRKPQQNPITLEIFDLRFDFLFVRVHTSPENFFYTLQTVSQI